MNTDKLILQTEIIAVFSDKGQAWGMENGFSSFYY